MRYIKKGEEPESFTAWKGLANESWTPTYNDLRGQEKIALHDALLQEQGYICCYCGTRVRRSNSHIEHLKPQSTYREVELEYWNLLASCEGEGKERETEYPPYPPPPSEHCGQKKGNWYESDLMVSPLIENCAEYFRYTGFGEIRPTNNPTMQPAAQETIKRLGLDNPKLEASRRKAIQDILPPDIDTLTPEEIQQYAQYYDQPDIEGKYVRFCGAIAYILNQYFIA
jgi:uncharacterized protein (TIGR02646 family)